ncbi:MAG: hypothetical protein OXC45_01920 [Gemmatimonadetes bacterium]|nr:hypothetical protein [Gemmatimonadota bacterium]
MTEPIRGKVAKVLNSREIAINIGSANGVTEGMYFDVMSLDSGEIKDPVTNKVLGSIKRTKVRVRVTEVQEKLAVASTYERATVDSPASFGPFARSLMPASWINKYEIETLRKSDKFSPVDIDEDDSDVKVKDPVVQVIEDKVEQENAKN